MQTWMSGRVRIDMEWGEIHAGPGTLGADGGQRARRRQGVRYCEQGEREGCEEAMAAVLAVMVARDAGRYSPCLQRFSASAPRAWRPQA